MPTLWLRTIYVHMVNVGLNILPSSKQLLPCWQLNVKEHISMEFYLKFKSFRENDVCKMTILSRLECVSPFDEHPPHPSQLDRHSILTCAWHSETIRIESQVSFDVTVTCQAVNQWG